MKEVLPQPTWWIFTIQRVEIHVFHIESTSSTGTEATSISNKIWVTERYTDMPCYTRSQDTFFWSFLCSSLFCLLAWPWACWVARSPPVNPGNLVNLVGCTQGTPHSSGWSRLQLRPRITGSCCLRICQGDKHQLNLVTGDDMYVFSCPRREQAKAPLWRLTNPRCFTLILLATLLPLVLWYSCHDKSSFSTQMSAINSPLSNNLAIFNPNVCHKLPTVQQSSNLQPPCLRCCSVLELCCYWLGYFHV